MSAVADTPASGAPASRVVRSRPTEPSKWRARRQDGQLRLAVLVAVAASWELGAYLAESPWLPRLSVILQRMHEMWFSAPASELFLTPQAHSHLAPSLWRFALGFGLALGVGIATGIALGLLRRVDDYVDPLLHFARSIPPPTLVPLFVVLLGIGDLPKVLLIAVAASIPLLLNTIDGARSVDETQLATARIFGITPAQRLLRIVLPAATPRIMAGVRISLAVGLLMMILSEMMAATNGLGHMTLASQRSFRMVDMWAGILMLGVFGNVLSALLSLTERRLLAWHRGLKSADR